MDVVWKVFLLLKTFYWSFQYILLPFLWQYWNLNWIKSLFLGGFFLLTTFLVKFYIFFHNFWNILTEYFSGVRWLSKSTSICGFALYIRERGVLSWSTKSHIQTIEVFWQNLLSANSEMTIFVRIDVWIKCQLKVISETIQREMWQFLFILCPGSTTFYFYKCLPMNWVSVCGKIIVTFYTLANTQSINAFFTFSTPTQNFLLILEKCWGRLWLFCSGDTKWFFTSVT